MRRALAAFLFLLALSVGALAQTAACVIDGAVKSICSGGSCTIYKEDCTVLSTPGSSTFGLQEAFNYAWITNKSPIAIRGAGMLAFSNVTLNIPPQLGLPIECFGVNFQFTNTAQDGIVFDTQVKSIWNGPSCRISYSGTGRAVLMQPRAALPYIPSQGATPWTADQIFNFGVIEASGGTPEALLAIDVRQVLGVRPDGFDSAEFAANKVYTTALEGNHFAIFNFRYYSPIGPLQAGGQNFFDLGYVQAATLDEFYIGTWTGGAYDGQLGTNNYRASIAHWGVLSGSRAIVSNAIQDRWELTSLNNYDTHGNVAGAVYWGPNAAGSRVITTQLIGWNHAADQAGSPAWANVICGYSVGTAC